MRTNEFSLGETKFHFQHWLLRFLFFATANQGACIYYQTEFSNCGKRYFPKEVIKERKKKLGNFECPNISPDPISRATLPPQSETWNSKYLTEHNHHVPQTQHALIAPSRTFSDHVCMNTEDLCSTEASSVCFYSELMNVQVGAASAAAEEPGTSSKAVDGVGRNWLLSGPDYIKILQI